MITSLDNFIVTTARQGQLGYTDARQGQLGYTDVDYNKQIRPCAYVRVFEGSIYDLVGCENSGIPTTAMWKRLEIVEMTNNAQQGQSRSINFILAKDEFETNGNLNYNYNTGIYTSNNGVKLGKYIVEAYEGYCENTYPYTEHAIKRFTGIIESIIPKEDGTIEVTAIDYSTIFLNALNYNYPDINSYRDIPYTDSLETLQEAVGTDDTFIKLPTNTARIAGDKIRIGSEVMVVLYKDTVIPGKVFVQRMASISSHSIGDKVYISDSFLVMPEDVYNDRLLSKYVPAYDNWKLTDAIRDLCIKAKFPLSRLVFDFEGQTTLRLGASDKYPYMNVRPVIDSYLQTQQGLVKQVQKSMYTSDNQQGYLKIERKLYTGLNDESFGEAKFKFEFGKSLWDCILSLVDGFGFRVYFDPDGNLTIKGVRQFKWLAPNEDTEKATLIENHVWAWKRWNINALSSPRRYTFTVPSSFYVAKFRFIANDVATNSITVKLVKYNGSTYKDVITGLVIPPLQKYQSYEIEAYRAASMENYQDGGTYGIEMTSSPVSNPPYFNGFLYLDNTDETSVYTASSSTNADIDSLVNSITDVRNQMTVVGQPKSQIPLISRVTDVTSIYGGKNRLVSVYDGTTTFGATSALMDGRYDKYATVKTATGAALATICVAPSTISLNMVAIYVKPQTTPVGTWIYLKDPDTNATLASHAIVENDLSSGGIFMKLPSTPAYYSKTTIKITATIDLEISEIECYEYDPAYNFTGFKKETLVVKQNITDKATNDWLALTQLEMHRRNIKSLSFPIYGNPMLELGDCILANAPQVSAYYDMRLWITGISTTISKINYTMNLTLVALPPAQSYTQPQAPDATEFPVNDAYDFAINKYEIGTNALLDTQAYSSTYGYFLLKEAITTAAQTNIVITNNHYPYGGGLSANDRMLTSAIITCGSEEMLVVSKTVDPLDATRLLVVVSRGYNGSAAATTYGIGTEFRQNKVLKTFNPLEHYISFGFALPEAKKVQLVVGVKRLNQVLAYVMEEKCIPAGVYKRENGIRWDGGINFAKVWPDTVDKIYLPPQESYNVMYNRMFNPRANTQWENPLNNYYWYNFDQNVLLQYDHGRTYAATGYGWTKTPYQWNATLIVKPVLEGYNGSRALVPAVTKTADIQVSAPSYKLIWGDITPTLGSISQFTVITSTMKIKKISGVTEEILDLNDAVYFDAFVCKSDGGNVNTINAEGGPDTGRRWIASIGLHSFIQWDMTDSQGKFIPAGDYKFCIMNVMDIFGEGVEVLKTTSTNIIDGSLKAYETRYSANVSSAFSLPTLKLKEWATKDCVNSIVNSTKVIYNEWPEAIKATTTTVTIGGSNIKQEVKETYISSSVQSSGGHTSNDPFLRLNFVKKNETTAWTWGSVNSNEPFNLFYPTGRLDKKIATGDSFFLSMFFKCANSLSGTYSTSQIWNMYAIIEYMDKNAKLQRIAKAFTFNDAATPDANGWKLSYITIDADTELPNAEKITGLGFVSRALDSTAVSALQALKWNENAMVLDIDSIQFGTGLTPPVTYQDPSGGPRISELFSIQA